MEGNIKGYDDYYPFGLPMTGHSVNSSNPNDDNKFTGHEEDEESNLNLYHAGYRMIDPLLTGFLSIDPLGSFYPQVSSYTYALNNPIRLVDRFGLCPEGYNEGDIWNPGDGSGPTACGPTVEVTAKRIEGDYSGFLEGDGRIIFDPHTREGQEGLYNYFYNNPDLVAWFVANKNFSVEARLIAMRASRAKGGAIFWTYAYHGAVSGVTLVSALSGVGAIGLGLHAVRTGGSSLVMGQLTNISLKASLTELNVRVVGLGIGIDSKENVRNAAIGTIGGYTLGSTVVRGVNFSNVRGPVFRSVSTGRFVSNTYGALRFGITNYGQSGLITNSIYNTNYFK